MSLNDRGTIAGQFGDGTRGNAYVRGPDGTITVFGFRNSSATSAVGIDNKGIIVGDYVDKTGNSRGLLRRP